MYLEFYSTQENAGLLSDLAPAAFQFIEEALRDNMTMTICRMSDPPQSMGHENLSFRTLGQRCDSAIGVDELIQEFARVCEPVSQIRNKTVGHNDLNTRIRPHDNPLPGITRQQIDRIVLLASQILNRISGYYTDSDLRFAAVHHGGAKDLIFWLQTAKHWQEEQGRTDTPGQA